VVEGGSSACRGEEVPMNSSTAQADKDLFQLDLHCKTGQPKLAPNFGEAH
jgi:hypothetical protein